MPDRIRVVGLGDLGVSGNREEILIAYGVGSAVAVCAYDPAAQLAGLLTVLLPESNGRPYENPATFANTGVPALIWKMEDNGSRLYRMIITVVGGATIVNGGRNDAISNLGRRNVRAVHRALAKSGVHADSEEIGGDLGRTVQISVRSGQTRIWSSGRMHWELQD